MGAVEGQEVERVGHKPNGRWFTFQSVLWALTWLQCDEWMWTNKLWEADDTETWLYKYSSTEFTDETVI